MGNTLKKNLVVNLKGIFRTYCFCQTEREQRVNSESVINSPLEIGEGIDSLIDFSMVKAMPAVGYANAENILNK